ncbi:MAG: hypothetical protein CVV44_15515 [Spirochaetae bacterium HGW-Spirochaetae-1]|jgi:Spy/CpxP family protein refolding chaperone|nr:MAG: hypothetical protein CVV44_15515 [Spirochaetae bacterium HGW-Spirochaetae-1]
MKKQIILTSILLSMILAAPGAFAHGWGRGHHDGRNGFGYGNGIHMGYHGFGRLEAMKEELNLTDTQVKQVFDLGTQYREKYFENRKNYDKLAELRIEHRKAVEKVLTTEQRDAFNARGYGYAHNGRMNGCPYGSY